MKVDNFKYVEIETKYSMPDNDLFLQPFKHLVETAFKDEFKFIYVQGEDVFFSLANRNKKSFGRFRKSQDGKTCEWTVKVPQDKNSTIFRKEVNIKLNPSTKLEDITSMADAMGAKYDTSIWKTCHIYILHDATLVYYSVRSEAGKMSNFLEIEVKEDMAIETEEEAMEIITKYEKFLKPLEISPHKRKRTSLREMYTTCET